MRGRMKSRGKVSPWSRLRVTPRGSARGRVVVGMTIAAVGLAIWACLALGGARAEPGAGAPDAASAAASQPATAPAATRAPTVRIVVKVYPPNRATVGWGKKKLGLIKPKAPLVIERPRDSGPLDLVVRADGCLPVHTRAYTFTDSVVAVKVTPLDKKNTLYGYREAPPPDADGGAPPAGAGPDGGVPPAPQ